MGDFFGLMVRRTHFWVHLICNVLYSTLHFILAVTRQLELTWEANSMIRSLAR